MAPISSARFDNLTVNEICDLFRITRRTVTNWVNDGCPRKPDNTMSAYQVHVWLLEWEKKKYESKEKLTLKDQKLEKDIELADAKIKKTKDELIERVVHEDTLSSRAKTFSEFWDTAVMRNVVSMAMQPVDTLRIMLRDFLCKGSEELVLGESNVIGTGIDFWNKWIPNNVYLFENKTAEELKILFTHCFYKMEVKRAA